MKITKDINGAGQSLHVRIDEDVRTVGVTISGEFEGVFQIIGYIDIDGREIELTPFNPDGTICDLNGDLPLDFFLDVGGFGHVKIFSVSWDEGVANLSAITTAAKRLRINGDEEGTGSEVIVTNFPTVVNVSGPLTNAQLRNNPVEVTFSDPIPGAATEVTSASILAKILGTDSDNHPLPSNFDYAVTTFTYDGDFMLTQVKVVGTDTYTRNFTNNGEHYTGMSGWIKT